MVTLWYVIVNGRQVAGPLTWEQADRQRTNWQEYSPSACVVLESITIPKSVKARIGGWV